MKKILLTISIVIVISIIAIVSYYKFSLTSVNNNTDEVYFEISYGMSINDVLASLEEKCHRNALTSRLCTKKTKKRFPKCSCICDLSDCMIKYYKYHLPMKPLGEHLMRDLE